MTKYANLYADGTSGAFWGSRAKADFAAPMRLAGSRRIAVIRVRPK